MSSSIPSKKEIVIIHYGSSELKTENHEILWVGMMNFLNGEKRYLFLDKKKDGEVKIIESLSDFIKQNHDKVFVHWSMNTINYGFLRIASRYEELTGKKIELYPKKVFDISEYLKSKYGLNYVERKGGRLNNLARLNNFNGASDQIVISNINASDRLELIYSIYDAELQGKLVIDQLGTIPNPCPTIFLNGQIYSCYKKYIESYIVEPYIDISYLKKRMQSLSFIYRVSDKEFMDFLAEDVGPTKKKYFEKFNVELKLMSLNKCTTPARENNFNVVFKEVLSK